MIATEIDTIEVEADPTPFELPTKVKLSDAIRSGAAIRPKAISKFYFEGKSCAIGAAYEAITGQIPPRHWKEVYDIVMEKTGVFMDVQCDESQIPVELPQIFGGYSNLYDVVVCL